MPKYLYRLLVFTLLLVFIPVASIGSVSYYIASQDIELKVNKGNEQILLQNQMRIEQVLKSVELAAVQYLNSTMVLDSLYSNLTSEDFGPITDLARGLYHVQSLSGVSGTYLINLEQDWMISNSGFTPASSFANQEALVEYGKYSKNLFWIASDPAKEKPPANGDKLAMDTIRLVVKLPIVTASSKPRALLIINMSYSVLESYLTQNAQLGRIYVLNAEREPFLASYSSPPLDQDIINNLKLASTTTGLFKGDDLAVNFKVAQYNNWSYVSVASIDEITKESKKIALITLNACLVIIILFAAAAFYGSRKMYTPIRKLFVTMEKMEGESTDLRQKDEFAYLEDRFNNLFSTRKELQQLHNVQLPQMKEFFLLKLFMGQITESEFTFKCETYGFTNQKKALGVLTLQIDTLQDTRYLERDKELLLFAINNIVGELIPAERMLGTLLLDQSQVSLLASDTVDPEELKAIFYETSELIKTKVHELLQLDISIGISRPFYKYTDAMDAYTEALEALKRRISLGNDIILQYDDIDSVNGNKGSAIASLNHIEEYFINALKVGDDVSAFEHYDKYVASIMERGVKFNDYQILMLQLITRIYQLVQQQGGSLDSLIGTNSIVSQFMKLNTAQGISAWFKKELLPPTLAFVKQRVESQYLNTAHQMVQLIHEQYDQDISLESCADQLKFHPVYLSRVFKKEIGVTFIDYLTDYRVNMAKKLLETTNLKISEIAERLNYNSSTGFIRTFRKITGVTPGQYRESQTKL
ncbi:AraC family transcriptional regulator [Paenibacillus radicis (ex Xue et al. 2023)]|uniref:AraC family transcriptional regulator n=1 Tax=Paenibacillus radicis (ex Xue et al. 2023) TaxID=2972489 RepID=A0ABT1YCL1_9BACL|nr:AraC family transcriptional regulator [Paenibacillus radicis (ex Xue et al. 2023)]MCR8630923.1 AraC family transcriptional regulator [Paenibacillus radicis (ex Xue et al. 2023)]